MEEERIIEVHTAITNHPGVIKINRKLNENQTHEERQIIFKRDAREIKCILKDCLPSGTYDYLRFLLGVCI